MNPIHLKKENFYNILNSILPYITLPMVTMTVALRDLVENLPI